MASELLSAMTPDEAYNLCVDFITTGGLDGKGTGGTSQADKLACYKYFKQVNAGDVPERGASNVYAGNDEDRWPSRCC